MKILAAMLLIITITLIGVYGNTTGWVRYTALLIACALIGYFWNNGALQ